MGLSRGASRSTIPCATDANFSFEQSQAPVHTAPLDFILYNCHYCIVDCATRGKWRIPDGKGGEWCVFMFGAPKVVAPACVD
jgi:hypothetical protein